MNSPPLWNALLERLADVFSVNRLSDWLSIAVLNAGLAVCVFGLFYGLSGIIGRKRDMVRSLFEVETVFALSAHK